MSYNMGRYTNTDAEEIGFAWCVDDVEDDDTRLSVTLCADYARLSARQFRSEKHEFGTTSTSIEIDVMILTEYLGYLRDDLRHKGEGTTEIPTYEDELEHRLVRIRWQDDNLVLEFEDCTTILITISKEMGESLADLLDAQLEELAAVEAAQVRVTKPYYEWERVIQENNNKRNRAWYGEIVAEQIRYRGHLHDDEVTVVFEDAELAEDVLKVAEVTLSATLANWQAIADILRADRNEDLALAVEDRLEGQQYGASLLHDIDFTFDWNESPEIEAVLWRLLVFGAPMEAQAV